MTEPLKKLRKRAYMLKGTRIVNLRKVNVLKEQTQGYITVPREIAVMWSKDTVIISNQDGAHELLKPQDSVEIMLYAHQSNEINLAPVDCIRVKAATLVSIASLDRRGIYETPLKCFVRNSRIRGSYLALLESMRQIGLNPSDYGAYDELSIFRH